MEKTKITVVAETDDERKAKEVTKGALIKALAEKGSMSDAEAKRMLDLVSETIMELLEDNDKLVLGNLGKIVKGISAAREGTNPRTKEKIRIPEKVRLSYRPSKEFKDRMEQKRNNNEEEVE